MKKKLFISVVLFLLMFSLTGCNIVKTRPIGGSQDKLFSVNLINNTYLLTRTNFLGNSSYFGIGFYDDLNPHSLRLSRKFGIYPNGGSEFYVNEGKLFSVDILGIKKDFMIEEGSTTKYFLGGRLVSSIMGIKFCQNDYQFTLNLLIVKIDFAKFCAHNEYYWYLDVSLFNF